MLKISYTDHGLERIKSRRISKSEVDRALRDGAKDNASGDLRKSIYRNTHGTLIVLYRIKNAEEVIIVTAYRQP